MDYREILPREILGVLVKWRRVILFNVSAITLLSVVISLALPVSFTATTIIMPPTEETMSLGLSAILGAGVTAGGFGGMAGLAGLPGFGTPSDVFAGLLQTRSLMERVIRRCNLMDYYDLDLMEDALLAVSGATEINVSLEGMLALSYTVGNAVLSAQVANVYIEELDRLNRKATMTRGKAARLFIEERLKEVKDELHAAEESLRVFQERYRTVSLEDEIAEAIKAVAGIQAEVISRDVQLGIIRQFATPENPQYRKIQTERQELERKLHEFEYGSEPRKDIRKEELSGHFGAGFGVPISHLPELGMELARRLRSVEIESAVFTLLTQQYEEARIMEARDTPTVQVIDAAVPPEKRSFPVRRKIVAAGILLGLVGGFGLAFVLEYLDRIQNSPEEREGWMRLYRQLCSDLEPLKRNILRRRKK